MIPVSIFKKVFKWPNKKKMLKYFIIWMIIIDELLFKHSVFTFVYTCLLIIIHQNDYCWHSFAGNTLETHFELLLIGQW